MLKTHMAACLMATALFAAPALAQTPATGQPATGAAATAPMNVTADQFVSKAANSNMFEIQSSKLALDKSKDNRLQEFAQQMIKDHTAAGEKLKAAAPDMTVPTSLDQEHSQMLQNLQQMSGDDFNKSYVQMQFDGHQKAVALFESYGRSGDNAKLKQLAEQTTPTLRQHFQHIMEIRNAMLGPAPQVSQNQSGQVLTQLQSGQWLASKLDGLNVYNDNNDKIGDIRELLLGANGKVEAVVIGVGGFLGVGERDVAVPFSQIKFVNEPRNMTSAADSRTVNPIVPNAPATTGATTAAGRANAENVVQTSPDHALLNMTKDQLKAAPEFKSKR